MRQSDDLAHVLLRAAARLPDLLDPIDRVSYVLWLLLFRYLSDHAQANDRVSSGLDVSLPAKCHWSIIASSLDRLGESLNRAGSAIEAVNPALQGVLATTNWCDTTKLGSQIEQDRIIRGLLDVLGTIDLSDSNLGRAGILGDASDLFTARIMGATTRRSGRFFTPHSLVRLLVDLLDPKPGMRICDPAAGAGTMLIQSARYVREHGGNPETLTLHGQERDRNLLRVGRLNLHLQGMSAVVLVAGDVLTQPKLLDGQGGLMTYDRVVASPPPPLPDWPFGDRYRDPFGRFERFGPPPAGPRSELAFLEHLIAITSAAGMTGVVLPHGALFRGGVEGAVRAEIVKSDLFESIIELPSGTVPGASVPSAVCILNKAKPPDRQGKILFISASRATPLQSGRVRTGLNQMQGATIVKAFRAFRDATPLAHVADLAEVERNDFILVASRYTEAHFENQYADVNALLNTLGELEQKRNEAERQMDRLLSELGLGNSSPKSGGRIDQDPC